MKTAEQKVKDLCAHLRDVRVAITKASEMTGDEYFKNILKAINAQLAQIEKER